MNAERTAVGVAEHWAAYNRAETARMAFVAFSDANGAEAAEMAPGAALRAELYCKRPGLPCHGGRGVFMPSRR
jgi:hypothetical protein